MIALSLTGLFLIVWLASVCLATRFQQRRVLVATSDTVIRGEHPHHYDARPGRNPDLENAPLKPTVPLAWEAQWNFESGADYQTDHWYPGEA